MDGELLSVSSAREYLRSRGVAVSAAAGAEELAGGVSNVVLAVGDVVVKQALPRLRVADEWLAKRERALTEAAAMREAAAVTPDNVPEVLDVDAAACALAMTRAPADWRTWKQDLLDGDVREDVGAELGRILAAWHVHTLDRPSCRDRFEDQEAFDQLRVDPYHRTVARRRPELAAAVEGYVERMAASRRCLVHGDYSPKNVLVGDGALWVVDFEVAHFGDPAFDVAFMLNHLLLKAIHRPASRAAYEGCAAAFWDAYRAAGPPMDEPYVLGQTGCLMVARVDGKSPAEYLTDGEKPVARDLGSDLLLDPPATLADAWRRLP